MQDSLPVPGHPLENQPMNKDQHTYMQGRAGGSFHRHCGMEQNSVVWKSQCSGHMGGWVGLAVTACTVFMLHRALVPCHFGSSALPASFKDPPTHTMGDSLGMQEPLPDSLDIRLNQPMQKQ